MYAYSRFLNYTRVRLIICLPVLFLSALFLFLSLTFGTFRDSGSHRITKKSGYTHQESGSTSNVLLYAFITPRPYSHSLSYHLLNNNVIVLNNLSIGKARTWPPRGSLSSTEIAILSMRVKKPEINWHRWHPLAVNHTSTVVEIKVKFVYD